MTLAQTLYNQEQHAHYEKVVCQMQKEEQKIKNKQAAGLMALQKRIQRDRDEQLHHRKLDSATLI